MKHIFAFFFLHITKEKQLKKKLVKNPNYVLQSLNTCFELYHFFQSNFGLLAKIIYCFFLTFLLICNIHVENCFAVYLQKHTGIYRNRHSLKEFSQSEHTQNVPSCLFHLLSSFPQRKSLS